MASRQYTDQELLVLHNRREQTYSVTLTSQRRHAILFEAYDISHTEYRVLTSLFFTNGCEPSIIAGKLMLLRQTMTKVLDSLEAKGYVVRMNHPNDRRRLFVNLLPKGRQMARELLCLESDYINRVDELFTPEELETYHSLFSRIQEARINVLQQMMEERAAEKDAATET